MMPLWCAELDSGMCDTFPSLARYEVWVCNTITGRSLPIDSMKFHTEKAAQSAVHWATERHIGPAHYHYRVRRVR